MLKNDRLLKFILDSVWVKFVKMFEYKVFWYGRVIVKVDIFYLLS